MQIEAKFMILILEINLEGEKWMPMAFNGAVVIHDFELALMGHTSEEVEAEIDSGRFGMAEETGRLLSLIHI